MVLRQGVAHQLNCVCKINNNTKINSNGGGQECPPHTRQCTGPCGPMRGSSLISPKALS
jgi:hypothetical protein